MSKAIANTVDRALDSGIESGRKAVKRGPIATADDRDTQASVRRHGDGPVLCNTWQQGSRGFQANATIWSAWGPVNGAVSQYLKATPFL